MSTTMATSTATLSAWIEPRKSHEPDLDGLSLMQRLWNQLDGIFKRRWAADFTSAGAVANWEKVWGRAFVDEGITPDEIARGLIAMRRSKFPPELPDFLAACRPRLTPEEAYHEAVRQLHKRRHPIEQDGQMVTTDRWSEPAIYWAAIRMESDLLNQPYERIKARWARVLDAARQFPKGAVPEYRVALPAKSSCPLTEAEQAEAERRQREAVGEILAQLGKRSPLAAPVGRKMKVISDDDLTARKAALDQLLAARLQREGQQGERKNTDQGARRLA